MFKNDTAFSALLVTMVLFGAFLFLLLLIKLPSKKNEPSETFEVAYLAETPQEKHIETQPISQKIETHRAFNQAEKYIEQQEQERSNHQDDFEQNIKRLEDAIQQSLQDDTNISNEVFEEEIKQKKQVEINSNNKNSTNSYRLVDRKAMYFPNPVYVCEGSGKVVVSIQVNDNGKVVEASIARSLSNTTDECLLNVALNYAKRSRFNSKANKPQQLGTITYLFPGQ